MKKELVYCPHCGKKCIEIVEIPGTIRVRRGFTGKRGPQWTKGSIKYLTTKCSNLENSCFLL